MKVFTVEDPVFKTEPVFILGAEPDELRAYIKKRRWKIDLGSQEHMAGQMFTFDRVPWRLVWTRKVDLPVILHEMFHLVTRICQDKCITIRAHDERGEIADETAAYLFEFFARAVLRRVRCQ